MTPLKIPTHQLYLLQLENYNLRRYLRLAYQRFFAPEKSRQKLVWTPKAILIFTLALVLALGVGSFAPGTLLGFVVLLVVGLSLLWPLFLVLAVILVLPFDVVIKQMIVARAKSRMKFLKNLKVVGITGSYGKTTMKEVLTAVLKSKFKVEKTPESVNTPVGISRLILKKLDRDTEIFIVEMGAYHRGDIKALCDIAKPDIAVLTGINEAHLERFGGIENTIRAKFEIVENAKPDGLVVLNKANSLVADNYQKYIGGRKLKLYNDNPPRVDTPILGEYIWGVIQACVIIAKELGMTHEQSEEGIKQVKPIPHRMERIENPNGITVIDDSYNGNPDGVREAIKVLASFRNRRKIYVTPGLVEMGERSDKIHSEIGRQLAGVADVVVLIKNSVTPYIAKGIQTLSPGGGESWREVEGTSLQTSPSIPPHALGREEKLIIWFDSASEAHDSIHKILKPGDVVMFQNDWPDNYL